MDDAVASYCAASEACDMQALAATFAPDVELPSPLLGSFRFRGREDVLGILSAVYALLGKITWEAPVGTGTQRLAIAHSAVLGIRIDDAMVFELNDEGYMRATSASCGRICVRCWRRSCSCSRSGRASRRSREWCCGLFGQRTESLFESR